MHSSFASRKAPPPTPSGICLPAAASDFKARLEAYTCLQAAAVGFAEKLSIPEIVALGSQSDGKSTLLQALLGFRFKHRRTLVLQMVHDPSALEPRCTFQVLATKMNNSKDPSS